MSNHITILISLFIVSFAMLTNPAKAEISSLTIVELSGTYRLIESTPNEDGAVNYQDYTTLAIYGKEALYDEGYCYELQYPEDDAECKSKLLRHYVIKERLGSEKVMDDLANNGTIVIIGNDEPKKHDSHDNDNNHKYSAFIEEMKICAGSEQHERTLGENISRCVKREIEIQTADTADIERKMVRKLKELISAQEDMEEKLEKRQAHLDRIETAILNIEKRLTSPKNDTKEDMSQQTEKGEDFKRFVIESTKRLNDKIADMYTVITFAIIAFLVIVIILVVLFALHIKAINKKIQNNDEYEIFSKMLGEDVSEKQNASEEQYVSMDKPDHKRT